MIVKSVGNNLLRKIKKINTVINVNKLFDKNNLHEFIHEISLAETEEEFRILEKKWEGWREFENLREISHDIIEGIMLS